MESKLEVKIHQFKDLKDRNWVVRITVGTMKRVRDELAIDLNDALDPSKGVIDKLAEDPITMLDVVYLCCEKQLKEKDVSAEDLSEAIGGETIAQASEALLGALVDFFPSSRSDVIRKALQIKTRMVERVNTRAMAELDNLTDEELDAAVDRLVLERGNASTTVQESSA